MLCSNNASTVKSSIESILGLAKDIDAEIVVVDNASTDGSWEVLEEFRGDGVRSIRRKCTRGEGRQLAFQSSRGEYILAQMDCDDEFLRSGVESFIDLYHSRYEGMMLMTRKTRTDETSNVTIAPRRLIVEVGGWRPVNWGEDWDLWNRAASMGKYLYFPYPAHCPLHKATRVVVERENSVMTKLLTRYWRDRDSVRLGRRVFTPGERTTWGQRLPFLLARASVAITRTRMKRVPLPDFDDTQPIAE